MNTQPHAMTGPIKAWIVIIITVSCLGVRGSASSLSSRIPLAFAAGGGGGGFGASNNAAAAAAAKSKKVPKKKKKGGIIKDDFVMEQPSTTIPILDKWGLPPPTEEDIFPLMSADTELLPAAADKEYSLAEIQEALRDYIPLDLSRRFDESGVEKRDGTPSDSSQLRGPKMRIRLVHQSPPVLTIENFFSEQECLDIQSIATNTRFQTNGGGAAAAAETAPVQINSATFSKSLAQSTRTSTSWFCHYASVPVLLSKAEHVLGIIDASSHMEEPQIVRYQPGQEFSWHYDQVPVAQLPNGGQRLATLLVYLNTVPVASGGGTVFRDLKDVSSINGNCNNTESQLTVQPVRGSALLFFPATANGKPDDRTLHKGNAVLLPSAAAAADGNDSTDHNNNNTTEKWIIQAWIHERSYAAFVPLNNRQLAAVPAVLETSRRLGYIP